MAKQRPKPKLKRKSPAATGREEPGDLPPEIEALVLADPAAAMTALRKMLIADRGNIIAHRLAGRALRALGDDARALQAERTAIHLSEQSPPMKAIERQVLAGDLKAADNLLCARLREDPQDAAALRILAALRMKIKRFDECETMLRQAIAIAPGFARAHAALAEVFFEANRNLECLAELDWLAEHDPENQVNFRLRPAIYSRLGRFDEARAFLDYLVRKFPDHYKTWMSYGHVLKTVGRLDEAIEAYRRSVTLCPRFGETWWSLANLKTFRFTDDDLTTMSNALLVDDLDKEDRLHLHFALGKALEDREQYPQSFRHYASGNAIRRSLGQFDIDDVVAVVDRSVALFTPEFFQERADWGCPAEEVIFILGMPRAGSTLVEQILSSHSMIEGTQELPDIPAIGSRICGEVLRYPGILADLSRDELRALGEDFLRTTRPQRQTDRPIFIDKLPNNWMHVGLIKLILPNARIVDARRHPMSSCFSNFKQHFAQGQNYTYDLGDVGAYYVQYVRMMALWDRVVPGAVHRLFYEDMVADSDREIRRLLDAMRVPFEDNCLRFWETERAVRTPSSEQVRRPINKDGLEAWKPYAQWLRPLEDALGDVLTDYPSIPRSLIGEPQPA